MNEMRDQLTLANYLPLNYRFNVLADPDGGYVIVFPDLPGCMTQVETFDEIGPIAAEIKELWLETAFAHGNGIPMPTYPENYSGKFNVRLPKSLHRRLSERAEEDGVSLNQLVVSLLSEGIGGHDQSHLEERFTHAGTRLPRR
jgi:antitoxin HicB